MQITDTLNGHTVEDVRRNADNSVTLYCTSGRTLELYVSNGFIEVKPPRIILPDQPDPAPAPSERMRLREAFLGMMVNYAYHNDSGYLVIVCEPLRHDRDMYAKAHGHREITLTHSNGVIDELPPVSAIIGLPSLAILGDAYGL